VGKNKKRGIIMNYLKRIGYWIVQIIKKIKEPWPLHLIFVFIIIHVVGIKIFTDNVEGWNSLVSVFLQIIGGLLVLKTINDNLGILSDSSLWQEIRKYFMSYPGFPKRKIRAYTLQPISGEFKLTSNDATLIANGNLTNTLEQEVELIKKEINRLDNRIENVRKELISELKIESKKSNELIVNLQKEAGDFKTKLKMSLVGGGEIKEEALGVLCIIYSLLIPSFTMLLHFIKYYS
jgi:hypothetical protein